MSGGETSLCFGWGAKVRYCFNFYINKFYSMKQCHYIFRFKTSVTQQGSGS